MSKAVAGALEAAQDAKQAYRGDGGRAERAAHREASAELRYARWLARGGPALEDERRAAKAERDALLREAGVEPDPDRGNGEIAAMYARWLDENPEG